jgi:hypothetical protein
VPIEKLLKLPALVVGSEASAPLLWPVVKSIGLALIGMFPSNGSMPITEECLGFEMRDGVVCEIGKPPPFTDPVAPLHPEMSLREQAIEQEAERAIAAERHANAGREREKRREELNAEAAARSAAYEKEQRRLAAGGAAR